MNISRLVASAPRTVALSSELSKLNGPCVGCTDCNGLCRELIETLVVPDVILSKKHGT
jgi:hypothetical protein